MNIKAIKNVAPNKNLYKKIAAIIASIIVIVVSFMVIMNANREAKETVNVLRIKESQGLAANSVLTEDNIEKYAIIEKEYSEAMVLSDDKNNVVGKFTKYYIRAGGILYKDDVMEGKPQKNEWLYELEEDMEVLTIPYDYLRCGGDILTPGDRIRIRVSYENEESAEPYAESEMSYVRGDKSMNMEVLFDSIVVKDMLNSSSHSIYEVYKEVLKLSEEEKRKVMKSEEFMKNIQPKALVLEGDRDQINNYAQYSGVSGSSFLITILSRENSDIIIDQLPTLENEVNSWISDQKKN